MADDKNLSGHYEIGSWYMHQGRRMPPGSRVFLEHDEAARLLAQKVAKPCDAPEKKKDDLAGDYIVLAWHMRPLKNDDVEKLERVAPGSRVSLSHEEAERLLAQGVARKFDPEKDNPPASEPGPEASPSEASAQDAKAAKKAAKKAPKAKADEPPASSVDESTAS